MTHQTLSLEKYWKLFPATLRPWQTRTHCCGDIIAHDVSWAAQTGKHLLRTQNVSEQNQNQSCVPDTKFVSATNVARVGKRGNICVDNNVSATMCPQQCVRNNVSSIARAFRFFSIPISPRG